MSRLLKVLRLLFAAFFRCLVLVSSDVRSTARAAPFGEAKTSFHDRVLWAWGAKTGYLGRAPGERSGGC